MGRSVQERIGKDVRQRWRTTPAGDRHVAEVASRGEHDPADAGTQAPIAITSLLQRLANRDDGYLRIIPDKEQSWLYVKWKFNGGPHAGGYAFVSGESHDVVALLWQLQQQIDDIYSGRRRATPDKPFIID